MSRRVFGIEVWIEFGSAGLSPILVRGFLSFGQAKRASNMWESGQHVVLLEKDRSCFRACSWLVGIRLGAGGGDLVMKCSMVGYRAFWGFMGHLQKFIGPEKPST